MTLTELKTKLDWLEGCYLPADYMSTRMKTPIEDDMSGAYLIRCHGEIEGYFERRCIKIVDDAQLKFLTGQTTSTIAALCGSQSLHFGLFEDTAQMMSGSVYKDNADLGSLIATCVRKYKERVADNNGIKAKNVLSLLLPIGVRAPDLASIGLARLTDLGTSRGRLVHSPSTLWSAKVTVDATTFVNKVQGAFVEVEAISKLLDPMPV